MSDWTNDRIEQLKTLWDEGLSCSQIARVLGGMTRCAVGGKVHRLKLPERTPQRAHKTYSSSRASPQKREPLAMPPPPLPEPEPVKLADGKRVTLMNVGFSQCRWPTWAFEGPITYELCGHPKVDGSPYCAFHRKLGAGSGTYSERAAARGVPKDGSEGEAA